MSTTSVYIKEGWEIMMYNLYFLNKHFIFNKISEIFFLRSLFKLLFISKQIININFWETVIITTGDFVINIDTEK